MSLIRSIIYTCNNHAKPGNSGVRRGRWEGRGGGYVRWNPGVSHVKARALWEPGEGGHFRLLVCGREGMGAGKVAETSGPIQRWSDSDPLRRAGGNRRAVLTACLPHQSRTRKTSSPSKQKMPTTIPWGGGNSILTRFNRRGHLRGDGTSSIVKFDHNTALTKSSNNTIAPPPNSPPRSRNTDSPAIQSS